MASSAPNLLTVEDLYELPDDDNHYELVRGHLVSQPPAGGRHGRIAARIVQRLGTFVEQHRLGIVLTCDPGFVLHRGPDTLRAPDVAFVATEHYDGGDRRTSLRFDGEPQETG